MPSSLPKRTGALLLGAVLIAMSAKYLLPISMPFLLALLSALAAEPLVFFFSVRLHLPRSAASGIGVSITLFLALLLLSALGALLLRQLQSLAAALPDLGQTALDGITQLRQWLHTLSARAPESVRLILERSADRLFEDSSTFVDSLSVWALSLINRIFSHLPDSALGIGTWLLACFMISAKLPSIRGFLSARTGSFWQQQALPLLRRLRHSVLGWLFAQLKLIGITFLVLWVGFSLLRISHAPLWAALIALVDMLPVLGTGTVLIPWSILCFLQADTVRAVGLLGLCALTMLLRSVLEPRIVGKQLGLDPLLTLAAMYTGYRLWGIGGMLLSPLLAITLKQLLTLPQKPESAE